MAKDTVNDFYQLLVREMEEGTKRDVFRVLLFHKGKDNAILGNDLVEELRKYYPDNKNLRRKIRLAIQEMRDDGILIACSSRGFFLPLNRLEFDEYIVPEYRNKIDSMKKTVAAQTAAADKILGQGYQGSLFNV